MLGILSPCGIGGESHCHAVDTDDYGNPYGEEEAPQPGEKLTVTYIDEGYYEDSRTGEPVTDATPEEYVQYHVEKVMMWNIPSALLSQCRIRYPSAMD